MTAFRLMRLWASLILLVLLAGCMVGPDYQRPAMDVPAEFREPAQTDPDFANLPWWELFGDPVLQELIEEALQHNRDLATAVSRIEESRANLGIVRANQFPFVDANASAGRTSPSDNVEPGGGTVDDFYLGGVASFELDLWGKLRRATAAARASLLATEANARNVTISLVASVANNYFLLLDLDDRLAIARSTLQSREHSLEIIRARFEKGTVPELDLNQAEVEVADAQAAVALYERLGRQVENALSVLVGTRPRAIARGIDLEQQTMPVDVPAGLPLGLLERRPDLQAAEQQLVAATELVGVARARRLPSFSLTGNFGVASQDLDDLLDGDSETWGVFGNIFAPLFNSGQLRSAEEAQRQRAEQARLAYEQAVLSALRDVDDALTAVRTLHDEHQARLRQLVAAKNAARLSRARYDGGVVSYLEVLDSERSLFQVALLESQTRQQQLSAVVRLYRELGGGWSPAEGP